MQSNGKKIMNSQYSALICGRRPFAVANIYGVDKYPNVRGCTEFYLTPLGVVVVNEIYGLPSDTSSCGKHKVYTVCIDEGRGRDFRTQTLPPLFGNDGSAWSAYLTDKITYCEIMGCSVIINAERRTLCSQAKSEIVAFGKIRPVRK